MSTIDEMVNRFLAWKLPADFSPDGGVSFSTFYEPDSPHWPTGTNLLTAQQAKGMFTHALAGDSETEGLRAALDQMHAEYEDMKSLLLGNARNLNLERERLHAALQLAVWAMRAPLDDWKGECERKALDAAHAALGPNVGANLRAACGRSRLSAGLGAED